MVDWWCSPSWASRRRRSVGVGPTDDLPASFLGMRIFNYCEAGRQADLKRSNECSGNNRNEKAMNHDLGGGADCGCGWRRAIPLSLSLHVLVHVHDLPVE